MHIPSDLFKNAIEKSNTAILIKNNKNQIIWINEAFIKDFGYEEVDLPILFSLITTSAYDNLCFDKTQPSWICEMEFITKNDQRFKGICTGTKMGASDYRVLSIIKTNLILYTRRKSYKNYLRYAKKNVALAKYSFGTTGPTLESAYNADFIPNNRSVLEQIGVYYMTIASNNLGLFGPFPVKNNPNLRGLTYSYRLEEDKSTNGQRADKRFKGSIPHLLVLIYDKDLSPILQDYEYIESVFDKAISNPIFNMKKGNKELLRLIYQKIFVDMQLSDIKSADESLDKKLLLIQSLEKQLSPTSSSQEVFEAVADLAEELLNFKYFSAWQMDRAINGLKLIINRNYDPSTEGYIIKLHDKAIIARAARTKEIQNIPDVRQDPDYLAADTQKVLSELAVPILHGTTNRVVGVLNIEHELMEAFSEEDKMLLEVLAEFVGQYMAKLETESRFLSLVELSKKLDKIPKNDIKGIFEVIKCFLSSNLVFKYFVGMTYDEKTNKLKLTCQMGYPDEAFDDVTLDLDSNVKGVILRSAKTKNTIYIPDVSMCDFYLKGIEDIQSELCAPIIQEVDEKLIGVLNVESKYKNAFTDTDINLFELMCSIISNKISD